MSTKVTMASQSREVNAVDTEEALNEKEPFMPHIALHDDELDVKYPALRAADEETLDDAVQDSSDATYQHGMNIAKGIAQNMQEHGRRRRDAAMSPITNAHNGDSKTEKGDRNECTGL